MLQDTLNTTQSSNDIHSVVVQLPQLPIMTLGCPPEWIANFVCQIGQDQQTDILYSLFQELILLPVSADAPSSVISQTIANQGYKGKKPRSWATYVCRSFWNKVLIRGIPRSQLSSRSSRVRRRFWALASFLFIEYSDQTRAESKNSASQGWR